MFVRKLQPYYTIDGVPQQSGIDIVHSPEFSFSLEEAQSPMELQNGIFICDSTGTCQDKVITIILYPNNPSNEDLPLIEIECTPDDITICDTDLGSSEPIEGLNNARINLLMNISYNELKSNWKFPESNDFAVYLDNNPLISGPQPAATENVFVKEIKYWKLNNNGVRTPVKINIRAW